MPTLKNPKHELFAQSVAKGINGPEAYLRAGYAVAPLVAAASASRLLSNANISNRIQELQGTGAAMAVEAIALTKGWVLSRLMRHADVCLGVEKVRLTKAVKSRVKDLDGSFTEVFATVEVEVTDRDPTAANRALELLGRQEGMFVERKEVGAPGDFANLTDEEIEREYRTITGRHGKGASARGGIAAAQDQTGVRGKPSSVH